MALAQETSPGALDIDSAEIEWQPIEVPGFPPGMHARSLPRSESGPGASRIPVEAGFVEAEHYHKTGAHSIYVLPGRMAFDGVPAGPGDFFHTPVNVPHALVAEEDTEFLI